MTYELEVLEELVTRLLAPTLPVQFDTNDELAQWQTILSYQNYSIRKGMKAFVAAPGDEREKERYVQRTQRDIINLENRLTERLSPESTHDLAIKNDDGPVQVAHKTVLNGLKELLDFIREFFPSYFDQEQPVPLNSLLEARHALALKQKVLKKKLNKVTEYRKLSAIVFTHIDKLFVNNGKPVPFRKLMYMQKLVTELEQVKPFDEQGPFLHPLSELLIYVNFNCTKTVHHLITEIVNAINKLDDQKDRIAWLYKTLKEIRQLPVKPLMRLIMPAMGLREQLEGWIEEEIVYLEKRLTLFSVGPVPHEPLAPEQKIAFTSPQPVLSLLVRSAIESKLVGNTLKKEVFEKVAAIVSTPGAKNLKTNSLVKKSYDPERTHRDQAIGILHEMIRCIMKY